MKKGIFRRVGDEPGILERALFIEGAVLRSIYRLLEFYD